MKFNMESCPRCAVRGCEGECIDRLPPKAKAVAIVSWRDLSIGKMRKESA